MYMMIIYTNAPGIHTYRIPVSIFVTLDRDNHSLPLPELIYHFRTRPDQRCPITQSMASPATSPTASPTTSLVDPRTLAAPVKGTDADVVVFKPPVDATVFEAVVVVPLPRPAGGDGVMSGIKAEAVELSTLAVTSTVDGLSVVLTTTVDEVRAVDGVKVVIVVAGVKNVCGLEVADSDM